MANKIRLTIGGMELTITTDDDEAYMQSLAAEVNRRMTDTVKKSNFLSTTMAAVIVALQYCDETRKTKLQAHDMDDTARKLTDDVASLRLESDEARREIERLNKENQLLRGKLSRQ